MTAETGHVDVPMAMATVEAKARSPNGEFIVGPENELGIQLDTHPLTQLHWRAARTLVSAVHDECWSRLIEESTLPPGFDPNFPRNFADAGISAVPFNALVPVMRDGSEPLVFLVAWL